MITCGGSKSSYLAQLEGLLEMTVFIVNTMYVTHMMKIIACTNGFSYPSPPPYSQQLSSALSSACVFWWPILQTMWTQIRRLLRELSDQGS